MQKEGKCVRETGKQIRKKIRKRSMTQTGSCIAAVLLILSCIVSGCGKQTESGQNITMGRYMEQEVSLPWESAQRVSMTKGEDGSLKIAGIYEADMASDDGGESFSRASSPIEYLLEDIIVRAVVVAADGQRLIIGLSYEDYEEAEGNFKEHLYWLDGTGNLRLLDIPEVEGADLSMAWYGDDGCFYVSVLEIEGETDRYNIYRILPEQEKADFLLETKEYVNYLNVCGGCLYVVSEGSLNTFDMEKEKMVPTDAVLTELVQGEISEERLSNGSDFLLRQAEEDNIIYVVCRKGLYRYVQGSDVAEQIIDGALCSMSSPSTAFCSVQFVKQADAMDFLILYTDGSLKKYVFDETVASVPDTLLRIWSLEKDEGVAMAVSYYQQRHPELYVKYETGLTGTDGLTREDALRNLTTELAAGKGPDILVMDNVPYTSYVEKGVLLDLSDCYAQMDGDSALFANIVEGCRIEDKLYTIPMSFGLPILTGEAQNIEGITTLAQLADKMEELRVERPTDYLFSFSGSENLLALLGFSSKQSWVTETGDLDMEKVTDFLTQAKRIYDAQMQGVSSEEVEEYNQITCSMGGRICTKEDIWNNIAFKNYYRQAYGSGIFTGNTEDYATIDVQLEDWEMVLMPGQDYGACETYGKLSVNAATGNPELATDFIETALSYDFQKQADMGRMLMNVQAYYEGQVKVEPFANKVIDMAQVNDSDGNDSLEEVYWPTEKQLAVLNDMVAKVHGESRCSQIVYDAVMEKGQKVLLGEMSIEEAADAIQKQVGLYLAE